MLDQYTFGKTPAAMYLVRVLDNLDPSTKTMAVRSCSVRIKNFNNNVHAILASVDAGTMSAHVATNLLRILRNDATAIDLTHEFEEKKFVLQLLKNVIIGHIKSAIRKASVLRKIEVSCATVEKMKRHAKKNADGNVDEYSIQNVPVAIQGAFGLFYYLDVQTDQVQDHVTPELLNERSLKRCIRLKKPHTLVGWLEAK